MSRGALAGASPDQSNQACREQSRQEAERHELRPTARHRTIGNDADVDELKLCVVSDGQRSAVLVLQGKIVINALRQVVTVLQPVQLTLSVVEERQLLEL